MHGIEAVRNTAAVGRTAVVVRIAAAERTAVAERTAIAERTAVALVGNFVLAITGIDCHNVLASYSVCMAFQEHSVFVDRLQNDSLYTICILSPCLLVAPALSSLPGN